MKTGASFCLVMLALSLTACNAWVTAESSDLRTLLVARLVDDALTRKMPSGTVDATHLCPGGGPCLTLSVSCDARTGQAAGFEHGHHMCGVRITRPGLPGQENTTIRCDWEAEAPKAGAAGRAPEDEIADSLAENTTDGRRSSFRCVESKAADVNWYEVSPTLDTTCPGETRSLTGEQLNRALFRPLYGRGQGTDSAVLEPPQTQADGEAVKKCGPSPDTNCWLGGEGDPFGSDYLYCGQVRPLTAVENDAGIEVLDRFDIARSLLYFRFLATVSTNQSFTRLPCGRRGPSVQRAARAVTLLAKENLDEFVERVTAYRCQGPGLPADCVGKAREEIRTHVEGRLASGVANQGDRVCLVFSAESPRDAAEVTRMVDNLSALPIMDDCDATKRENESAPEVGAACRITPLLDITRLDAPNFRAMWNLSSVFAPGGGDGVGAAAQFRTDESFRVLFKYRPIRPPYNPGDATVAESLRGSGLWVLKRDTPKETVLVSTAAGASLQVQSILSEDREKEESFCSPQSGARTCLFRPVYEERADRGSIGEARYASAVGLFRLPGANVECVRTVFEALVIRRESWRRVRRAVSENLGGPRRPRDALDDPQLPPGALVPRPDAPSFLRPDSGGEAEPETDPAPAAIKAAKDACADLGSALVFAAIEGEPWLPLADAVVDEVRRMGIDATLKVGGWRNIRAEQRSDMGYQVLVTTADYYTTLDGLGAVGGLYEAGSPNAFVNRQVKVPDGRPDEPALSEAVMDCVYAADEFVVFPPPVRSTCARQEITKETSRSARLNALERYMWGVAPILFVSTVWPGTVQVGRKDRSDIDEIDMLDHLAREKKPVGAP